jgi:phospholipid N-methyltransferase
MPASDAIRFLGAFLRSPTQVGAIAPSSEALARAIVRGLDVAPGESVIEFGPGTGVFTKALRDTLADRSQYMGIERDPHFVGMIRDRYPDMRIVEGSAADAKLHHAEAGLGRVRAIVCGLPFASLPPSVQDAVIDALNSLLEVGSEFRTFQYVHAYPLPTAVRFRRQMSQLFGKCERSRPVIANLPPAYVLRWRR